MYAGHEVPLRNEVLPELTPYKPLDSSRLLLFGNGSFDATDFLADDLCMAYRMPQLLRNGYVPVDGEFPKITDSAGEVLKLAKLWDSRGLLFLSDEDVPLFSQTRVFNNFKNLQVDRQIGDRRGMNLQEGKLEGPSRHLPAGSDLVDLHLDPVKESYRVFATDRRDFYHQFWVTPEKARENAVGPRVRLQDLRGLEEYDRFTKGQTFRKSPATSRETVGDRLHDDHGVFFFKPRPVLTEDVHVCFRSLFQGDHIGVEVATSAHEHLLQAGGLLAEHERLLANVPFHGGKVCQGLVIDDYFCMFCEKRGPLQNPSEAFLRFQRSQAVYEKHKILGSPHKDVL